MDPTETEIASLEELETLNVPEESIKLLREIQEEHPDSVSIVASLLKNGWSIAPSGEQIICITLSSASKNCEVLGHGHTLLDAFEEIQRKTKNFSTLLTGVEIGN